MPGSWGDGPHTEVGVQIWSDSHGLLQPQSRPRWPLHPWLGNPRLWPGAASPGSRDQRKGQVEERKGADPWREAESKELCCLRPPSSEARESPVSAEPASTAAAPGAQSPLRRTNVATSASVWPECPGTWPGQSCLLRVCRPARTLCCLQRLQHRLMGNGAETRGGAQLSSIGPGV